MSGRTTTCGGFIKRYPAAGEVVIFNRSHYEDVLVPPVNGWITPEQTLERYRHINEFERMLSRDRNGDAQVHAAHQL